MSFATFGQSQTSCLSLFPVFMLSETDLLSAVASHHLCRIISVPLMFSSFHNIKSLVRSLNMKIRIMRLCSLKLKEVWGEICLCDCLLVSS